jgi:hypothetical protein
VTVFPKKVETESGPAVVAALKAFVSSIAQSRKGPSAQLPVLLVGEFVSHSGEKAHPADGFVDLPAPAPTLGDLVRMLAMNGQYLWGVDGLVVEEDVQRESVVGGDLNVFVEDMRRKGVAADYGGQPGYNG